jgi:hypothetical protein
MLDLLTTELKNDLGGFVIISCPSGEGGGGLIGTC